MKVGDIVYLKSGSPKLTVVKIENGSVFVSWYINNSSSFCYATLNDYMLVSEEDLKEIHSSDKKIIININEIKSCSCVKDVLLEIIKDCQIF